MELKQIKELMAVMQRTGTKKVLIKKDGFEVELEREERPYKVIEPPVDLIEDNPLKQEMALHRANMLLSRGGELSTQITGPSPKAIEAEAPGSYVTSPMVGTFYTSAAPDQPPFVKVGDRVEKDSVICIVEAMKVMNEVKAGIAGTVAEILVDNAHPVEFGTKLFRIVTT